MSEHEAITWSRENDLRVITFTQPDRANALSIAMADAILAHVEAYAADGGGPLLIESTGRSFCAGVDLSDAPPPGDGAAWVAKMLRMQRGLAFHPGSVVAAVQGPAVGSGAEICVAADLVIATAKASFCFPEAKIGTAPGISSSRLARSIGEARALEILLSGRVVRAEEAVAIGLVNRVVSPESLAQEARAMARRMIVPDPAIVGWIKRRLEPRDLDVETLAAELGGSVDASFAAARSRGRERP